MNTTNPTLEEWRQLVAGARSALAAAQADYTREKSRVEVVHAGLFRQLRESYQKRDRLRLAVDYRQKFLDSFVRDDPDEVEQAEKDLQEAKAELDADYEKMAAAAARKISLTAGQESELTDIWQKLVTLYHPDHFADEPDKLETYHHLTAAIDSAKHSGDTETLRKIAADPESFQRQQGWATLNLTDVVDLAQLQRLHETLLQEIAAVMESLKELRAGPDYELCQLADQKPGVLAERAAERARQLVVEIAELEQQAEQLATEIKKLSGQP